MDSASLDIILPIFGILVAGYVVGRLNVLRAGSSEILSQFVFLVSLPALVFVSLSRIPVVEFFNWPFLGALGGGMLITFLGSLLVARTVFKNTLTATSLHALTAMFSSTAYIGLPLILVLFGNEALVPGIIGAVITGAVFMPMGIVLAEVGKGQGQGSMSLMPLLAILRNPVLIATAAGLSVSALDLSLPPAAVTFCELLGGALIPCALFAAGLFIASCSVRGEVTEIGWLVGVKLIFHPLITWWLAYHVFELEGILPAVAVLQAALPSGVPVFVLAQRYGVFVSQSSAVIVLSTAVSIVTLSILIVYL